MNLEDYLTHIETNVSLSRRLGVAPSLVSQWRCGTRPIPFERGPQIERASNYQVLRSDIWPNNYMELWPELGNDPHRMLSDEKLMRLVFKRDQTILALMSRIKTLEKELAIR